MAAANEPSDLYNRAKRNLVIVVGLLAVVLLGYIGSNEKLAFAGIHLESEAVPTTLALIALYLLYQYWLSWSFQPDAIKKELRHDFFVTIIPAIVVLLGFVFWHGVHQTLGWGLWEITQLLALVGAAVAITSGAFLVGRLRSSEQQKTTLREQTIQSRLFQQGWKFNFNPKYPYKIKPISFNADGTIGEGRNDNETSWRWDGDVLELIRSDGKVQNRLRYNPDLDRFVATQPSATNHIKDQYIYRDS
jgi:hypothetical protein